MRAAWLLLCSGCQILFPLDPGTPTDGPPTDGTPPSDGLLAMPACDGDPALIACFEFDGSELDSSPRGNHPTVTGAPDYVEGVTNQAIVLTPATRLDFPAPNFGGTALTIDVWVNLAKTPGEQIVIDHQSRWALSIGPQGEVSCWVASGDRLQGGVSLPFGGWHHLACTQTMLTSGEAQVAIYLDGVSIANDLVFEFGMTPNTVAAIGSDAPETDPPSQVEGALDRFRVWDAVLDADAILRAAGRTPPTDE